MAGTAVATGAVCGTFLCGQKVCGEVGWSLPYTAKPTLTLGAKGYSLFLDVPVVIPAQKPSLVLSARATALEVRQAPQFGKPQLLLQPSAPLVAGSPTVGITGRPWLELRAKAFLPELSGTLSFEKPWLELGARDADARIPGLIASEDVDLILVPSVPEAGLLLTPVDEEDLLLVPSSEAVG